MPSFDPRMLNEIGVIVSTILVLKLRDVGRGPLLTLIQISLASGDVISGIFI